MLVDVGYAILDSYENEMADLDNLGGNGGGRAALSTIPSALVRWNEESRVIDGDSVHDCVTALKPEILQVIYRASHHFEARHMKGEAIAIFIQCKGYYLSSICPYSTISDKLG
jgi:hypothetical protein